MEINAQPPVGSHHRVRLISKVWNSEVNSWMTRVEQGVPHTTDPELTHTFNMLSQSVVNERNTNWSWLITESLPTSGSSIVSSTDDSFSRAASTSLQRFVCRSQVVKTPVDSTAAKFNGNYGTLDWGWKRLNDKLALATSNIVEGGFGSLTMRRIDENGTIFLETQTVVEPTDAVPTDTSTVTYTQEKVDCWHAIRTATEVQSTTTRTWEDSDEDLCLKVEVTQTDTASSTITLTPGTQSQLQLKGPKRFLKTVRTLQDWSTWERESFDTIDFTFPQLLLGYATSATFVKQQLRTAFKLDLSLRPAFSARVRARIVETLHAVQPTEETLFNFRYSNIGYDGVLFNVPRFEALTEALVLTANTNSLDTYYGFTAESYSIDASTPALTTYQGMIGDEVCISDRCVPLGRYCLIKRTRVYINLQ